MNSYDVKTFTDHLAAITDHVEAVANSGTSDALADVYNVLDGIGDTLTQISNTLARTLDREQTRFITVTRVFEGITKGRQHELVSVGGIERVFPRDGGGAYLVIPSDTLRVAESLDEISTMINAGAYVPPF